MDTPKAFLSSDGSPDSPDRSKPLPRPKPPPPKEKPPFVLPPANSDHRRVFAYLRKRGTTSHVIQRFLDARLLYEDAPYHNCVFVGRDGSSQLKFASKRGTRDLSGSSFKRDVLGSDKKVGFRLPCDSEIEEVAVFEAPTDLMSFCTLCLKVHSNAVALCGLYSGPLDTYHHPHLKAIKLLLDHDEPGIMASKKQWATEYLPLYPSANILVAAKKDFETKNQKRFCGRIATEDYGAIIIEHSQFENIPVSIERQRYLLRCNV